MLVWFSSLCQWRHIECQKFIALKKLSFNLKSSLNLKFFLRVFIERGSKLCGLQIASVKLFFIISNVRRNFSLCFTREKCLVVGRTLTKINTENNFHESTLIYFEILSSCFSCHVLFSYMRDRPLIILCFLFIIALTCSAWHSAGKACTYYS